MNDPKIYNKSKKEPLQPRLNQSYTRKNPGAAGLTGYFLSILLNRYLLYLTLILGRSSFRTFFSLFGQPYICTNENLTMNLFHS